MMECIYGMFKGLKPWTILFTLVLGLLISFPGVAWSRSKALPGVPPVYRDEPPPEEIIPGDWERFMRLDGEGPRPVSEHWRRYPLQAKERAKNQKKRYQNLSPEENAGLKGKLRQWQSLPPERQQVLRRRLEDWKQLPREEREHYRRWFEQWQKLAPEERQRIREVLRKGDNLTPAEREELRRRFRTP